MVPDSVWRFGRQSNNLTHSLHCNIHEKISPIRSTVCKYYSHPSCRSAHLVTASRAYTFFYTALTLSPCCTMLSLWLLSGAILASVLAVMLSPHEVEANHKSGVDDPNGSDPNMCPGDDCDCRYNCKKQCHCNGHDRNGANGRSKSPQRPRICSRTLIGYLRGGGSEHPIIALSGRQPVTFYLC